MSELKNRILCGSLRGKASSTEETIPLFKTGMTLGFSGFSGGNPKRIPLALADHVETNRLQGELRFNLLTGASIGLDVEERWAKLGMIDSRWPYQASRESRNRVNRGDIRMGDCHLSMFPQNLVYGFHTIPQGRIDIAIIEATGITEQGEIILSEAVGISPELVMLADQILIEVNTAIPSFAGLHDIVMPNKPPGRQPYPITRVDQRIGSPAIPCDPNKIVAIVESHRGGVGRPLDPVESGQTLIAQHILGFLQSEIHNGRLPTNLLPLQSGVGSIANAVLTELGRGPFDRLEIWTEVMHDTVLDLQEAGKLAFASGTSLALSPSGLKRLYDDFSKFTSRIVLRPSQISNHPEIIRRLGVIAMNTPVEFDLYGHANSSHVCGSQILNGIGGSGDFLRNGYLSILHTPSTRPTPTDPTGISCVVPMVSHVDHTEHDLDVLVTEQGLADLRGRTPLERAKLVIERCAHPDYRPLLRDYLEQSTHYCLPKGTGHQPHLLSKAFKMHQNLVENGTMKIENWN